MKRLIVVAVAALCCAAFADGPKDGPRKDHGRRGGMGPHEAVMSPMMDPVVRMVSNPKVAEKLGLSEEQKAKLSALSSDSKQSRESQKKVRDAMRLQAELLKADKIDESAVMATIDEVFELRKQMAKEQAKRVIQVKSVLTPEQIAKARKEMKNVLHARQGRGPKASDRAKDKGSRDGNPECCEEGQKPKAE